MLVVTRKPNESMIIGDRITVTVIQVDAGKVRLGFDLPAESSIHRAEVHRALASRGAAVGAAARAGGSWTASEAESRLVGAPARRHGVDRSGRRSAAGVWTGGPRRDMMGSADIFRRREGGPR